MPLARIANAMAAIWKGSIAFGLVNVPVELRAAVRDDHISFRLLHKKDNTPVKYERVRSDNGKEVPWSDIVKGYEQEKGEFVVLTDADFKAAAVERSESIEITKAYVALREAMRQANVVGIGTIILRQKQHLSGLHVTGDALVLEIMRFADEIVPASEYSFPAASDAKERKLHWRSSSSTRCTARSASQSGATVRCSI